MLILVNVLHALEVQLLFSECKLQRPSLADERRAHLKSEVMADPELLKELGEMVGGQNLAAEATRKAAIHEENTRAMAASLVALKHHAKTTIGRNTYNAVLAAVAGAGEHTCNPALPCNPTHRCPPAAPGHPAVSLAARAESLGVRDGTFREARARMHGVNLSVPPQQAVEQGRYLWSYRNTRNDATDQCVLDLARRFWHSDDISRASGNSGTCCGGDCCCCCFVHVERRLHKISSFSMPAAFFSSPQGTRTCGERPRRQERTIIPGDSSWSRETRHSACFFSGPLTWRSRQSCWRKTAPSKIQAGRRS